MDAISFVLGIKSSHLRSSHLRDLVYRGRVLKTSTINGDGSATTNHANGHNTDHDGFEDTQSNPQERHDPKSAWVMAVYEDDAGDEQQWKRTITSQGSSEYRINGSVVTAQQYNTALEAENILIKARNFLVFQGDVEQIASQSPKDLTKLIEQISGSLEHKAEYEKLKEAQEAALENQNYNLNRRRGINSEIKQYQEQKREADNYAKKAEQRDQAIVTHILWKLYHFQKTIEESSTEILKHQEEMKEHRRGIAKYEKNLEDARQEQAKVARDVGKVERNIKKKEKEIEELENSLVPVTEKIYLSEQHLAKANARITGIQKELDSKSENIKRLRNDLRTIDKAEAQWETEWRKLGEREGRVLNDADLQEYSKLREEVGKRTSMNQTKASNHQRHQRTDEETVNSMKSKVDAIDYQAKKLRDSIIETKEYMRNAKELIKQTSADIESKKKDLNNLASERLRSAQIRTELDEKLQDVLTKLLDVEDGRKQNDRENRLKATVIDMKRIFPAVRGRLGELCKPKQKRYAEAVATVLGRHFDAIVVDDEKTAKECIQYLRDQHRGQLTFIPLDTIQVKAINSSLKGLHRGTRMALDTIDYDKAVDRAMSYACGNAIVCDDLAIAKYVCYERGVDAKAVTLDGTVIHKGGLMTGGRSLEQSVRRWEDTEVDNLRKLAEKLQRELLALPETRRNATAEEALQGELTGLEQRLTYAKEEAKGHERNLSSKEKELHHAETELSRIKPSYEAKLREFEDGRIQLHSYQDAVSKVEDEVFAGFCKRLGIDNIRTFEAQQGSLQQEGAQKKLEFKQQKNKLESRINFEEQQLQETKSRANVLANRCALDQSLIADLVAQKNSISSGVDVLSAELDQLQEQLESLKIAHGTKTDQVVEQRREVQKRSKHLEGTMRAMASLESEIHRSAASRYTLLRKCKLEDITIPLADNSQSLNQLPIDGAIHADSDTMDLDEDHDQGSFERTVTQDYGIEVDFKNLDESLMDVRIILFELLLPIANGEFRAQTRS
jgi:structural maintenance of chromosome 1